MLRVPCGLSVIVAILQRLCDAITFAPVCCTYCASDSFLVSRNCEHSTVCRFFASERREHHSTVCRYDPISCNYHAICHNLPMLALHCCKYYPMAKLRAMNWCCIMPCNVRVLAAECCKYRASLRQILRSLEILTANDQHMVHRYFFTQRCFHKDMFSHMDLHIHVLLPRDGFTRKYLHAQVFLHRDAFIQNNFCTQTRG